MAQGKDFLQWLYFDSNLFARLKTINFYKDKYDS